MEEMRLPALVSNYSSSVAQVHSPISGIVKRLLVLLLLFGVVALGLWSFRRLPIDTFPDPTPMGFRYALGFLLLGASIGLYQELSYFDHVPYWERAIYDHLTHMLFGWIGLLVASVSSAVFSFTFANLIWA